MRWIVTVAMLMLLMPHAVGQESNKSKPRRVSIETVAAPQDAVLAFAAALEAEDFRTAYALLTPPAQSGFVNIVREGRLYELVPGVDSSALSATADGADLFADVLAAGTVAGTLPFDLEGAAIAGQTFNDPKQAIHLVQTSASGIVVIRTKLTALGWRVDNIAGPGLSPRKLPWGPY